MNPDMCERTNSTGRLEYVTCGRENVSAEKKLWIKKISGYMWTGPNSSFKSFTSLNLSTVFIFQGLKGYGTSFVFND